MNISAEFADGPLTMPVGFDDTCCQEPFYLDQAMISFEKTGPYHGATQAPASWRPFPLYRALVPYAAQQPSSDEYTQMAFLASTLLI
jgi:hypothetical protein